MSAPIFRAEGLVAVSDIEASRRAAARASLPLALSSLPAMAAASVLGSTLLAGLSVALVVLGQVALFASGREEAIPPTVQTGTVTVDDEALTIEGKDALRIARSRIERAREGDGTSALVRLKDGTDISVILHDAAEARALVDALGADAGGHAARFPVGRKARRITEEVRRWFGEQAIALPVVLWAGSVFLPWILSAGAAQALGSAIYKPGFIAAKLFVTALSAFASIAGTFLMVGMMKRREVTVGSDGLLLPGMFTSRFMPYASIERVSAYEGGGVRIEAKSGEVVQLPGAPGGEGLLDRIRAALEKRDAAEEDAGARLADLDRRGRSAEEWRQELDRIARMGEGYRGDVLSPERLAAVVEDAKVAADRRVGAAILLAAQGDDASRKRIRIAADACADEDMRAALEQAAEGEIADEPIERAARRIES